MDWLKLTLILNQIEKRVKETFLKKGVLYFFITGKRSIA